MKLTLTTLTFLLAFTLWAQKEPIEVAKGYQIAIQTSALCTMCQHAIEYDLTYTKGVKQADLNLENKMVTVVYNPDKISADEIRRRITKVGYHADDLERDATAYENLPFCCKDGNHGSPIPQVPTKKGN
ncbi:MAG: heavy metal-associated domain-containing protein [Bacteroidota bacterium]